MILVSRLVAAFYLAMSGGANGEVPLAIFGDHEKARDWLDPFVPGADPK